MPEYLAPGVYVEETGFRAKAIAGVPTSTAAFVGLTAFGDAIGGADDPDPPLITSFAEFERQYGGSGDLTIGEQATINDLAHAARGFFDNGGKRLYVARLAGGGVPSPEAYRTALDRLLAVAEIAIVAAPGAARFPAIAEAVNRLLIDHAEAPGAYRIAVLDPPPALEPDDVIALRGRIDSTRAALYYPWLRISDPLGPREIDVPPSGHVCGIYARTDTERGVWKPPANEVVRGVVRVARAVSHGEQQRLNPIGINCIRAFEGRGIRLWGARTISSDPEWKYVSTRRYFLYLEASIDRGTQWAVFEPNGEALWADVRGAISDFLSNEWTNGALLGATPDEAFFVKCDRSTMTQNDLDNGRLIALIGVAAVRPGEFTIFRIGQKTADARG